MIVVTCSQKKVEGEGGGGKLENNYSSLIVERLPITRAKSLA